MPMKSVILSIIFIFFTFERGPLNTDYRRVASLNKLMCDKHYGYHIIFVSLVVHNCPQFVQKLKHTKHRCLTCSIEMSNIGKGVAIAFISEGWWILRACKGERGVENLLESFDNLF